MDDQTVRVTEKNEFQPNTIEEGGTSLDKLSSQKNKGTNIISPKISPFSLKVKVGSIKNKPRLEKNTNIKENCYCASNFKKRLVEIDIRFKRNLRSLLQKCCLKKGDLSFLVFSCAFVNVSKK